MADLIECDVLPTRGIIFPATLLGEIGFLDQKSLPHYGSDFEWTARAKRSGYKLYMRTDTFMISESNALDKRASGQRIYESDPLKYFQKDLFNRHKNGNIYDLFHYSRKVFKFPYNGLFFSYNASKRVGGFLYSNYIKKRSTEVST